VLEHYALLSIFPVSYRVTGTAVGGYTMIKAKVWANADDTYLVWSMPFTKNCRGFEISRELTKADGTHYPSKPLLNYVGFEGDDHKPGEARPSTDWPFQRYTWTDHGVDDGDTVTYAIVPVMKTDNGLKPDPASRILVGPVKATGKGDGSAMAYFNRGLLLSQFMAKKLKPDWGRKDLSDLKEQLKEDDNELRQFLMGQLGKKLYSLMDQALAEDWHVYAALYELEDQNLIDKLKALGNRAHLVLANGSTKKKGTDGNKEANDELEGVIDLSRRMLWSEGLAHNKFVVFSKGPDKPFLVWTGSLNWSTTGLCTQLNNGIMVEDPAVASAYRQQWQLLKDDYRKGKGNKDMHFGTALMASNDEPKTGKSAAGDWTVWFTRTSDKRDLAALNELVNQANDAILFIMFEPGANGLLPTIQNRMNGEGAKKLYVQGVVNTLTAAGKKNVDVELVSTVRKQEPFRLKVVEPEGLGEGLAGWAHEVMRDDFLISRGGAIGYAITHSKMVVLDPLTNPVVITGSHNLSESASTKNDEQFMIIRGDRALAERYAVNIMGVYEHYAWRALVKEKKKTGEPIEESFLKKSDVWQEKLKTNAEKLAFWLGDAA
jgi:phosphatidylserine/phosphatidylglycerophosphate/cardiolipin synthase-like enzyme